ncbi:hypothetical protein E1301_Tti013769 [Triplophysa tibetana]|uniref:Uncharacterized protein n=1 Tax=Triplophysa tibetana TaxID=1572043 RepID=A0A5A9NIW2_9TELE|nr:hypothetical protein E1301_Tti013769 [Triplophysa tibetana]
MAICAREPHAEDLAMDVAPKGFLEVVRRGIPGTRERINRSLCKKIDPGTIPLPLMKLSAREYCSQTITQKPLHHRRPISDNGYWENYNVSEEGGTQADHTLTLTQSSPQDDLIHTRHRRWPGINSVKLKIGKREMSAVVRILKTNLWRGAEKRSTLRNDSSKPHENKTCYPSLQKMKDRCDYLLKDKMMSYKFLPCGCHSCLIVA